MRAINVTSTTVLVVARKPLSFAASGTGVTLAGPIAVIASGTGAITATLAGIATSVTWTSSDAATATALVAAINANTAVNGQWVAFNPASGVVLVQSRAWVDQMPAVGATGSGITVGGVTTPLTTLTISTGSGVLSAYLNGVLAASVTATGTDATDAAALALALNRSSYATQFGRATSAAGVVTFVPDTAISLSTFGGPAASAAFLTASGTYGGVAGNALTLTSSGNCTRSGATLTTGVSGVLVTATSPGVSGNWMTFAAGGAASSHVTASGTRLGGSPAGAVAVGAETTAPFAFD